MTITPAGKTRASGPVLLVEDSVLIAMDAEEMLEQLGAGKVAIATNVGRAMEQIEMERPRVGFLDYNLGDETSDAVAQKLHELGVPFWFVTGYGDAIEQLCSSEARGVLQKPYRPEDFEQALAELEE